MREMYYLIGFLVIVIISLLTALIVITTAPKNNNKGMFWTFFSIIAIIYVKYARCNMKIY